jgi:nucleoside-triphosphatase THEP1
VPDAEFGDPGLGAIQSRSTLRFRTRAELEASLTAAGFVVQEVRDAPDRPGRELVFLARRADASS